MIATEVACFRIRRRLERLPEYRAGMPTERRSEMIIPLARTEFPISGAETKAHRPVTSADSDEQVRTILGYSDAGGERAGGPLERAANADRTA